MHYELTVAAGESRTLCLRLSDVAPQPPQKASGGAFGTAFDELFQARRKEADEFYATVIPATLSPDAKNVMRQALGNALVQAVLSLRRGPMALRCAGRSLQASAKVPANESWHHMYNADIVSMPDKWEYPWYAAWDLAFHVVALTMVDPDFGKQQLDLMLRSDYLHPNGQLPAYEWNFGDVNPPVHAWSHDLHLSDAQDPGARRRGMVRAKLSEAADELHLVGQSKRSVG